MSSMMSMSLSFIANFDGWYTIRKKVWICLISNSILFPILQFFWYKQSIHIWVVYDAALLTLNRLQQFQNTIFPMLTNVSILLLNTPSPINISKPYWTWKRRSKKIHRDPPCHLGVVMDRQSGGTGGHGAQRQLLRALGKSSNEIRGNSHIISEI